MTDINPTNPPPPGPWVSLEAAAAFAAEVCGAQQPALDIAGLRAYYRAFNQRHLDVALSLYDVTIAQSEIAGIPVHIVRPANALADEPADAPLLICLHGGGFMWGEGPGALLEAVPVAAVAGMTVVAVEYRMAPEHVFPAAVDDIVAVFRALAGERQAGRIGVYGCSAGAALTAQTAARLLSEHDALPGAIAMLHAAGVPIAGDSAALAAQLNGLPAEQGGSVDLGSLPYFTGADLSDPRVMPGEHRDVLAHFPPSLLISGTRDFAASAVTVMHRRLLQAGATAELVIFDGLWHAHHMATGLPESRETFDLLARFFRRHLA